MTREEKIDEIDWLIFELKPGLKLCPDHYVSFEAVGVECLHDVINKPNYGGIIETLKNKRETLI
jgi:hypothetical protein